MRVIAFAYTFHSLNWFSKTSVIRWHEVGKRRLAAIASLWIALVGVYIYDYSLGFRVLFCLSFMHIYLEFPLNHLSIMGTFRELRLRLGGQRPGSGFQGLPNPIDIKHQAAPNSPAHVLNPPPQPAP